MRLMSARGLRRASTYVSPRFIPSLLDGIEDIRDYRPGGFHPMTIGDTFDHGRFRILHKLGFGGASTVWLARDQKGPIVALKALRADISSRTTPSSVEQIPEVAISQKLKAMCRNPSPFRTVDHHFSVHGPNGTHTFLVHPFAGPSISAMYDCPGRVMGSRRLRADLARSVAKQVADALCQMHSGGIVHGDLTTSNIFFRSSPHALEMSDIEVHARFGDPETEDVKTFDGQPVGNHAPPMLVEPIRNSVLSSSSFFDENVVISDFGQSYVASSPPPSYKPGTLLNYMSPEAHFANKAGLEGDVWSLGCAIFEIRAGSPLFEPFLASDGTVLMEMVDLLGRLPEPWWDVFKSRGLRWTEGRDEHASLDSTGNASIRARLLEIGKNVDPPDEYEGRMIEEAEMPLPDEEIILLADLLEKMLKYRPEERITMADVVRHPWFMFCPS